MMQPGDDRLTDALRRLPRTEPPPPELERRILEQMRAERLLRPRRWSVRLSFAAIFAFVTFTGGYVAGSVRPRDGSPSPTHLLLVYDTPAVLSAKPEQLAQEYGRWAMQLAESRQLADGAELVPGGVVLRPDGQAVHTGNVGGYFLLHARDDAQALAIARTCPHLRYGGLLELRRLRN
jgi:hypothetical protein